MQLSWNLISETFQTGLVIICKAYDNGLILCPLAASGRQRKIGQLLCLMASYEFCRENVRNKLALELKEQLLAIK